MARKLLTLFFTTFLLLNLISNNNNNVNAAETEAGAVVHLDSDSLGDKENGALQEPIAEQASEPKEGLSPAANEAVDEKDNEDEEDENNSEKETVTASSANIVDGEDKGLKEKDNNEEAEKLREKRRQNRLNRRRRLNKLRNRRRRQENAETDFQEFPLSEHAHEEEEEYRMEPTTENIVDIDPVTEAKIQESRTEAPKHKHLRTNKRSRPQRKNQKKHAAGAQNRRKNGNARNRGTTAKKQNARKPKARPARRQPVRSARRSTKKFMLNGIKFPQNPRGKAPNRNRQQRLRGWAGRRSNFRRRH